MQYDLPSSTTVKFPVALTYVSGCSSAVHRDGDRSGAGRSVYGGSRDCGWSEWVVPVARIVQRCLLYSWVAVSSVAGIRTPAKKKTRAQDG